ncbi:MAG: hypothetical protein KF887_07160 [Paracoccaceae bacterium]|nr:MAG: hypothetical protein KF887_07160 [Paracoccaceae bacterium]
MIETDLPTRDILIRLSDAGGLLRPGMELVFTLSEPDQDGSRVVTTTPTRVRLTADGATVPLWPPVRGLRGAHYRVQVVDGLRPTLIGRVQPRDEDGQTLGGLLAEAIPEPPGYYRVLTTEEAGAALAQAAGQAALAGQAAGQADGAAVRAEEARDATTAVALFRGVYDDVETALGPGGVAEGESFGIVVEGIGTELYRHDPGPVATYLMTVPSDGRINGLEAEVTPRLNAPGVAEDLEIDPVYRVVEQSADGRLLYAQRWDGRLDGGGIGFASGFAVGDIRAELVDDPRFLELWLSAEGYPMGGITRRGQLVSWSGSADGNDALNAPDWTAAGDEVIPVCRTGQSLDLGTKSSLPAPLFAAMQEPVLPGRAFTFGRSGPRFMASHDSGRAAPVSEVTLRRLENHRESARSNRATSAWTFLKQVGPALPGARFVTFTCGVGGSKIEVVNTGPSGLSRRRALAAMRRFADTRLVPFARRAVLMFDHGNANKDDGFEYHKGLIRRIVALHAADIAAAGGTPDSPEPGEGLFTVLTASAGVYSPGTRASEVPLAQLAVSLEDPRVAVWGPEYVCHMAIGALAEAGEDDPVHRSALGQMQVGAYQARAWLALLAGAKRMPLYCPGPAVLAPDGLSVSWTYLNPEAGPLEIDTTLVTDPATDATYEAADPRRPFGILLADATGKLPHPTVTVSGVSVSGNEVTASLSSAIGDPATAMVNVANYYDLGANAVQGNRHGARACIRNTSVDTVTIGDTTIRLDDYAVPQRLTLTGA